MKNKVTSPEKYRREVDVEMGEINLDSEPMVQGGDRDIFTIDEEAEQAIGK